MGHTGKDPGRVMNRSDTDRILPVPVDPGPLRDVQVSESECEPRQCATNERSPWRVPEGRWPRDSHRGPCPIMKAEAG
jgi:hypothetical protein